MTNDQTEKKTEKEKPEPKPKTYAGFPLTSTIHFGEFEKTVGEGDDAKTVKAKYGGENNPKRKGSNSHAAFDLYKEGMTLEAYSKLEGAAPGHIKWDTDKGFIVIKSE